MMTETNLEDIRRRAGWQALYALLAAFFVAGVGGTVAAFLGATVGLVNVFLIVAITLLAVASFVFIALRKKREERTLERVPREQEAVRKLAVELVGSTPSNEDVPQNAPHPAVHPASD